jgi:hypothetical protein
MLLKAPGKAVKKADKAQKIPRLTRRRSVRVKLNLYLQGDEIGAS